MADSDGLGAVEDGYNDVAQRSNQDSMRIGEEGRVPFQRVYMLAVGPSAAANPRYDPKKELLVNGARLAKGNELLEGEQTKMYLEVGIIDGKDPNKYLGTGKGRDKSREAARRLRGVQERDENTMRVFIPVTERIQTQTRYYVGCMPVDGRLTPRLVSSKQVFFYPEFWLNVDTRLSSKDKLKELGIACRTHAANIKEGPPRVQTLIVLDDDEKIKKAHPSITTASGHLASYLALQFSLFQESNNGTYLTKMRDTIEKTAGIKEGYGCETSSEGLFAFLDFEESLSAEFATQAAAELEASAGIYMTSDFLAGLHSVLSDMDEDKRSFLTSKTLPFFFDYYKEFVGSAVTKAGVDQAVRATAIHDRTGTPSISLQQRRKTDTTSEKLQGILSILHKSISTLCHYSRESSNATTKKFGGILERNTTDELMADISEAIDKPHLQGLISELFAFEAEASEKPINRAVQTIGKDILEYIQDQLAREKDRKGTERPRDDDKEDGKKDGGAQAKAQKKK
ncbi:hypothetical protein SPBR_04208 [Sporothrix brasiliensis 5110]|uniref:Uncharacterized protein n=1 Tax=Sporothrix brasiliensis 5110 TaxID=1398154 RepID=A0A0C2F3E4_9PEZI|nr:uncharacterized protein SPBR_04208 [Sporothrix brasiliensis 5110]KIH93419.1 hypothetical protein SPBR_04208 [Sporothrix brasiliensis 5110]